MSTSTRASVVKRITRLSKRRPTMSQRASTYLGVCYVVADERYYVWRVHSDHIIVRSRRGPYIFAPHPQESDRWQPV